MRSLDKIQVLQLFKVGRLLRSVPLFVLYMSLSTLVMAQNKEIGFGPGMLNYTGDLSPNYRISNNSLAGSVFYRYIFSPAVSARASLTFGGLKGSDMPAYDAVSPVRNAAFKTVLTEIAFTGEYYFFDIVKTSRKLRFSPYLYAGVGMFYFSRSNFNNANYSNIQPVVPFGLGYKVNLTAYWSVTFETGMRKLFFDYLDGVSDGDITIKDYQYGNPHNKDWYYHSGFSICYTLYSINCPTKPPRK